MNPAIKNYCPLAINFHPNLGQSNSEVKFMTQANGYNLLLTPAAAVMLLKPSASPYAETYRTTDAAAEFFFRRAESKQPPATVVQLRLSGANKNPQVLGVEEFPGKVNYFIGNAPDKWHTDIPTYAKVKYLDVYPGIDMIYSGNNRQLEWDFIVHPGADPSLISLDFAENEDILLDAHGNLLLTVNGEQIRISKPVIYQEINHHRSIINGDYLQNDRRIGFQMDKYDSTKPLIIDPIIEYSTYLGGTQTDYGYGIASDASGNVYITGYTESTAAIPPGFPVSLDAYQLNNAGFSNAFITKITAAGALVYSTYLGGSSGDTGWSIAIDAADNIYVTGSTSSIDFPTNNPIQGVNNSNGAGFDVFVTKLNAAGNALIYSTYLGGSQDDIGYSITVDPSSNAYVTGFTQSSSLVPPGFPTKNPIQPDNNSVFPLNDAFVTKINADGTLGYSTYLGGSNNDIGYAITADSNGNAFLTGSTMSAPPNGFPITPGCFQPIFGGNTDAFVTKINADGSLGYSSYLGGGVFDEGQGITVDSADNTYVTGYTSSLDFPTQNPLQPNNNGNFDAFITKINAGGSSLVYSTYLGGTGEDKAFGIAVDTNGYTYVTGSTYSSGTISPPGFPLKNPLQTDNNGLNDAFISKITPDGSDLIYSTYLGGKSNDQGYSIAADSDGNTYVTGFTFSSWTPSPPGPPPGPPGFPVVDPIQDNTNGPWDVFVLRLAPIASLAITKIGSPNPLTLGENLTYQITVKNNGPDPATNVILTDTLPSNVNFISASSGCGQIAGVVTCNLGILAPNASTTVTIVVKPTTTGFFTNTAAVTSTQSAPVSDTITTEVVLPPVANLTITKSGSPNPLPLGQNLTYQITVKNNGPASATNVILTDTLPPNVNFLAASSGCGQIAGVVTCDLGTLAPNSSAAVTIIVKPMLAGSFTNTATVTSTQSQPVSATITTTVFTPVFVKFTNITVKRDWQKNPPRC